eukprot:TRINITY_DN9525_c0_g1_i1.p1 TRINITY_DN9525_c0_g1~~TRINITY_DN9525_c0_g1_i1.p1  ORF type:complete len:118 (-),score=22.85 TRINITY_DN9525_c0_g1_i1:22-330(-)
MGSGHSSAKSEFAKVLREDKIPTDEQMRIIWNGYDKNKNGILDLKEFKLFSKDMLDITNKLQDGNVVWSEKGAHNIFKDIDKDNNDQIDFKEFVAWFHKMTK